MSCNSVITPPARFAKGERVLYYDGDAVYIAKCIYTVFLNNIEGIYYIEYNGFDGSYNRWVFERQLRKFKDMKKPTASDRAMSSTSMLQQASEAKSSTSEEVNADMSKDEDDDESDDDTSLVSETKAYIAVLSEELGKIKIEIPYELKTCLIVDGDMITKYRKLACLPADLTVDKLLKKYIKFYETSHTEDETVIATDVFKLLRKYFNSVLTNQLLYRAERNQHENLLAAMPGVPMSKIYGAIHFLRLFTRIADLFDYSKIGSKKVAIQENIEEFLKYLYDNRSTWFGITYYA